MSQDSIVIGECIAFVIRLGVAYGVVGLTARAIAKKKRRNARAWSIGATLFAVAAFSSPGGIANIFIAFIPPLLVLILPATTAGLVCCKHCAEHIQPQAQRLQALRSRSG